VVGVLVVEQMVWGTSGGVCTCGVWPLCAVVLHSGGPLALCIQASGTIRHRSRSIVCQSGFVWLCTSQQLHLEVAAALKACTALISRRMAMRGTEGALQHAGL
jgi:hypothetical protein